jgi:peroxiredoxin
LWDELISLANTPYLEPTDVEHEQVMRLRYLGAAYFHVGRADEGRKQLEELRPQLATQQTERDKAGEDAKQKAMTEGKDENAIAQAVEDAKRPFSGKIRDLELAIAELEGWDALAGSRFDEAIEKLRKAEVTPPALAQAQLAAGKTDEAVDGIRKYADNHRSEVQPIAALIDVLWKANRQDDARKSFEELRAISSDIDMQSPVFTRLTPIAQALGFGDQWRVTAVPATDVGSRPPLDTLGPFRWQPSLAPEWQLADSQGIPFALKQYHGQTVVLLFYLGNGCLHCAEQLKAFAPMQQEFATNGISLIGISSDNREGLRVSLENYAEPFSIPLVADPEFNVFRAYRAYDDFEHRPLHATFIVDPEGRMIWHDISYEPFMDPHFVLKEALRQRQLKP